MGMSMTLFPLPVQEMSKIIAEWGGKFIYDGAHQAGLIAGKQFQDPLNEGAAVLTGSAGKTFSGPQSGMLMWNDPALTEPLTEAIFPVLAATHQVNRVAALAVSAAEMLESVLAAHRGYSQSHQVIADVKQFGGGLDVAHKLAEANIITNKNLIPGDGPEDWDRPSGLRVGTIEATVLVEGEDVEAVRRDVEAFRLPLQDFYYCFDNGWPAVG